MRRRQEKDRLTPPTTQPALSVAIDFCIVTALEVERKAVCSAFGFNARDRVKVEGRIYWRGRIPLDRGKFYEIAVVQAPDMANLDAALVTADALRHWNPRAALMVGIAASTHDAVRVGDVVVARDVAYYERGKTTPGGVLPEPKQIPADPLLWAHVIAAPDWDGRVPQRPDKKHTRARLHQGVIVCGEKVIADLVFRDETIRTNRKILALEMEGYGFSLAAWCNIDRPRHLVIRGICDDAGPTKDDRWHGYAARSAASYAKHFLQDTPIAPRVSLGRSQVEDGDIGLNALSSFMLNTTSAMPPWTTAQLDAMPLSQRIIERALSHPKFISRKVSVLAKLSGMTIGDVTSYCDISEHITRSPHEDTDGNVYYGYRHRVATRHAAPVLVTQSKSPPLELHLTTSHKALHEMLSRWLAEGAELVARPIPTINDIRLAHDELNRWRDRNRQQLRIAFVDPSLADAHIFPCTGGEAIEWSDYVGRVQRFRLWIRESVALLQKLRDSVPRHLLDPVGDTRGKETADKAGSAPAEVGDPGSLKEWSKLALQDRETACAALMAKSLADFEALALNAIAQLSDDERGHVAFIDALFSATAQRLFSQQNLSSPLLLSLWQRERSLLVDRFPDYPPVPLLRSQRTLADQYAWYCECWIWSLFVAAPAALPDQRWAWAFPGWLVPACDPATTPWSFLPNWRSEDTAQQVDVLLSLASEVLDRIGPLVMPSPGPIVLIPAILAGAHRRGWSPTKSVGEDLASHNWLSPFVATVLEACSTAWRDAIAKAIWSHLAAASGTGPAWAFKRWAEQFPELHPYLANRISAEEFVAALDKSQQRLDQHLLGHLPEHLQLPLVKWIHKRSRLSGGGLRYFLDGVSEDTITAIFLFLAESDPPDMNSITEIWHRAPRVAQQKIRDAWSTGNLESSHWLSWAPDDQLSFIVDVVEQGETISSGLLALLGRWSSRPGPLGERVFSLLRRHSAKGPATEIKRTPPGTTSD